MMKLGRLAEARAETERAMEMTQNLRERELLGKRLKLLGEGGGS